MVSPATFRHPSVLARMAPTVDHVSGGRVEVGMGAGWYEREHRENGFAFRDARTRFGRFAEQVEVVVRYVDRRELVDHVGEHYHLEGQTALPRPLQQPTPTADPRWHCETPLGGTRRTLRERVQHRVCDTGGMRCTQSHADCCVCGCRSGSGLVAAVAHDSLRRG